MSENRRGSHFGELFDRYRGLGTSLGKSSRDDFDALLRDLRKSGDAKEVLQVLRDVLRSQAQRGVETLKLIARTEAMHRLDLAAQQRRENLSDIIERGVRLVEERFGAPSRRPTGHDGTTAPWGTNAHDEKIITVAAKRSATKKPAAKHAPTPVDEHDVAPKSAKKAAAKKTTAKRSEEKPRTDPERDHL